MDHELSDAEGLLLGIELQRIYGDRPKGTKWFLPFADVEATLNFLQRVPSNSGDAGIHQALAEYSANESRRVSS